MKVMPRTMLVRIRFPKLFPVLLLLSLVQLRPSNAQNVEPFKFFRDYLGLKEDQIAAIRNGKAIAKVVDSRTPDEVFVFGSVYVHSTPEKYLKLASDIDALRKLPSYLAISKVSDPPQLSEFNGFTLEADDLKQLKNCEPGKCDVQLPGEAMDTFKHSVNWSAPDAATQANHCTEDGARSNPPIHARRECGPWNLHGQASSDRCRRDVCFFAEPLESTTRLFTRTRTLSARVPAITVRKYPIQVLLGKGKFWTQAHPSDCAGHRLSRLPFP